MFGVLRRQLEVCGGRRELRRKGFVVRPSSAGRIRLLERLSVDKDIDGVRFLRPMEDSIAIKVRVVKFQYSLHLFHRQLPQDHHNHHQDSQVRELQFQSQMGISMHRNHLDKTDILVKREYHTPPQVFSQDFVTLNRPHSKLFE